MLFNSVSFAIVFAIFYSLYASLKGRSQTLLLLFASYVFYALWDTRFLALLCTTTIVDYFVGLRLHKAKSKNIQRLWLLLSLSTNLGILFFFKYFNFFLDNFSLLFSAMGLKLDPITVHIILPVGISFYTFRSITYTVDIYRGQYKPTRSLVDYAVFVSFFPELIAGPIERARVFLPQISQRRSITYEMLCEGCWLFFLGCFKKVVVADNLSVIADAVFGKPADHYGLSVLLGIYAYTFQIYGDFSGYSDMARGLARLLGFSPAPNFQMPYFSTSPQDFWRRWHISLSTWLRDYLYISFGGNRKGTFKTYRNLFLTMLLGGLWHGAAWNFVFWGAYHGGALIVHRLATIRADSSKAPTVNVFQKIWNMVIMFHVAAVGWVLFRVKEMGDFLVLFQNIFSANFENAIWAVDLLIFVGPLIALDIYNEYHKDTLAVFRLAAPIRLFIYGVIFSYIVFCGKVGGQEFIYAQF